MQRSREVVLVFEFLGAPIHEVARVEGDTKEIGRDKAELGGTDANHADDGGVDSAAGVRRSFLGFFLPVFY